MTVTMRPTVTCDGCGRSWPGKDGENVFDLRSYLEGQSWSNEEKLDYCPSCTSVRRHPAGGNA